MKKLFALVLMVTIGADTLLDARGGGGFHGGGGGFHGGGFGGGHAFSGGGYHGGGYHGGYAGRSYGGYHGGAARSVSGPRTVSRGGVSRAGVSRTAARTRTGGVSRTGRAGRAGVHRAGGRAGRTGVHRSVAHNRALANRNWGRHNFNRWNNWNRFGPGWWGWGWGWWGSPWWWGFGLFGGWGLFGRGWPFWSPWLGYSFGWPLWYGYWDTYYTPYYYRNYLTDTYSDDDLAQQLGIGISTVPEKELYGNDDYSDIESFNLGNGEEQPSKVVSRQPEISGVELDESLPMTAEAA